MTTTAEKTQTLTTARNLPLSTLRALYRAARAAVCARDGIDPKTFDEDCEAIVAQYKAGGWTREAAMTSTAVSDFIGAYTSYHVHTSPETRAWSALEDTTFCTTERHAQGYSDLCALAGV